MLSLELDAGSWAVDRISLTVTSGRKRRTIVEVDKRKTEFKTKPEEEPFDVRTVNPCYKDAGMSDVARAPVRPKDPKVWRRSSKLVATNWKKFERL